MANVFLAAFSISRFSCSITPKSKSAAVRPFLLFAEDGIASRSTFVERYFRYDTKRIGTATRHYQSDSLIETIVAAFEMDEILYELREHSSGLNAGRWDYIFSCIKKFKNDSDFCLADRAKVTMTAPFMRAYALLLLKTCHKRNAPAIGGMSALIPIKNDPEKK